MPIAIAVIIAAVGIGYAMSRVAKLRKEFPELAEKRKPTRQSRREKRLEQIRAAEPAYVAPTLDELIAAEIADEGIGDIAGSAGLAPGVMLKVYKRDMETVKACPRQKLRFVVADGVQAEAAEFDDVRLACDAPAAESEPSGEANAQTEDPESG